MPDQNSSRDYELADQLAEEFAQRYARGERPSVKEYCDRHPELADLLRDLLPAMAQIEQVKEGLAVADERPAPAPAAPVQQLGDFHILREVGRGGMGVVYEAEQVSLGRRVALKVLTQQQLREAKQKRRFEREAKAAAKLHHTNIVPVFGTGEHDGTPYYVMQFIQGMGLDVVVEELARMAPGSASLAGAPAPRTGPRDPSAQVMARSLMTGVFQAGDGTDVTEAHDPDAPPAAVAVLSRSESVRAADTSGVTSSVTLPGQADSSAGGKARKLTYWQSVARVGVQVAEALDYAHKQGVLHRDIKPSNLLLDLQGTVWVTDFGLAKAEGGENLTHTGDIVGTLRYMPPEAFDGRADARGDVYSLGLTLYELAALRPAFDERDRNRLIKQVTAAEPAPVGRVRRGVPRDLETIVHKAIDGDPGRRYQTAGALAADLQRFVDDEPIQARRQTLVERYVRWARHHPGIAVLGAVLTAVLVVATVAALVVAGHMTRLATQEAKAADDERAARREAEEAKEREAKERGQAEEAGRAADDSRRQALAGLAKAEEHFAKARAAVNDYFTAVSDDQLLKAPGLQGLRAQLLQSALRFYQDFLRERGNDPSLRRELAGVYYKVGEIYKDTNQGQAANQSYRQALRLYEALAAEAADDTDLRDGLARSLLRTGQREPAIAIWEKIVRPDDPRYQADLAHAYNERALSAPAQEPSRALEGHLKALAVRERLVRLRPDDALAHRDLAGTLNNVANLLRGNRPAEALALYRRATELLEQAYKLQPSDLMAARWLTIGLHNLSGTEAQLGHDDEAVAASRRRVEVLDRRVKDNPDVPGLAADMATGYGDHLGLLTRLDRLDEADRVARQACERVAEVPDDSGPFLNAADFVYLAALAVAEARARARPDGAAEVERAAAAAVAAMRRYCLIGWWDPQWLRTQPSTEPLRGRADFRDLLARAEGLHKADTTAKTQTATAEEKLTARQAILSGLEALAASAPTSRVARRALAQARQNVGQALLDAGRADEARAAFDEALAIRRQLVEEAPKNEQLRADLAVSQTAAGDLLAAAGRLGDAARTWDAGLATLEVALKANPNSVPYQTALAERLTHVAYEEGQTGLLDRALRHYRRTFQVLTPTRVEVFYFTAVLMAEVGDIDGLNQLAASVGPLQLSTPLEKEHFIRLVALLPKATAGHLSEMRRLVDEVNRPEARASERWIRGLTALRTGNPSAAVEQLTGAQEFLPLRPTLALAQHRAGEVEGARASLREADLEADRHMRDAVAGDRLRYPLDYFDAWQHVKLLQREAHQAIHGRPPPESPYDRLYRGRVLFALDRPQEAEAEFAAAVELRPDDADVWLTRARVFAKLGRKDRANADLARAQQLKADDPRPWVEAGRLLAELGEHDKADAAFARASALGKRELNRFLEAGWWVAGPYPDQLDVPCPPEMNPDPSKPVAAVGRVGDLKWQTVPATPLTGRAELGALVAGTKNVSFYQFAYVYADRDRTANLYLRASDDARLWMNGRLAFDGFAAWKLKGDTEVRVPVSLKAGRNTLLVKGRYKTGSDWCDCLFQDHPGRRALELAELGLWAGAADAFAEADRRSPLDPWQTLLRARCLLTAGREEEYRRVFAEAIRRYDRPGGDLPGELVHACYLSPEQSADRNRWAKVFAKEVEKTPNYAWAHYYLGMALYRAARFDEAEKHLRRAVELEDSVYFAPVLASTCQRLGKAGEAHRILQRTEERFQDLVKADLQANPYRVGWMWHARAHLLIILREARTLVNGTDPGLDANERALQARGRERLAQLDKIEDDFARLVETYPDQPRLWTDRGRRLAELGRRDEAAKAFARATELQPKEPQVLKERGRAYAELGKWDEAAADFSKALDLTPEGRNEYPYYPWRYGRGGIGDLAARWDEVFDRVAKLRPKDVALWARRAEHFAAAGKWAETEAVLRQVVERFPDDWWAPNLLAKLLLRRGDVAGYTQVSKQALERFAARADPALGTNIGRTALLAPAGLQDDPLLGALLERAAARSDNDFWTQVTAALTEYRRGDAAAAIRRLTTQVKPFPEFANTQALADAVLALACHKAGQAAEAREALAKATTALNRHRPRPERGWLYDWDWHNWVQVEVLTREAESLIPNVPAAVAQAVAPAQEEAARRERKARSDKAATDLALALVRLDVGQKAEAEATLRAVLAEQTKLAAEEPGNPEYRSRLAAGHQALGQLLADLGRLDLGLRELAQAVAVRERLVAEQPKNARFRAETAAAFVAVGDLHMKADRPANAARAWKAAIGLLDACLKEDPKNRALSAELAGAEYKLGDHYASYALWDEAGELLARSARRPGGGADPWRWLRAGQALLAAGRADEVRKLAAEALDRFGTPEDRNLAPAVVELLALTESRKETTDRMLPFAEATARDRSDLLYVSVLAGIWEYRAGHFAEALRRLDAPGLRGEVWTREFLAMAHHRLGHAGRAREWLARAEDAYAGGLRDRLGPSALVAKRNWYAVVNEVVFYREAHALITGRPLPPDPLERLCRARAYYGLGESEKARAELRAAVEAGPDDAAVWLARGRVYAAIGRPAEAAADRARAKAVAGQALADRPGDADAARQLTDVLLDEAPLRWKVVKPERLKSDGGATLTVQPDGSVLASGTSPDRDVYTMELEVDGPVTAIRLEALTDPSLPNTGPGRSQNGNFHLDDVRVSVAPAGKPGPGVGLKWAAAFADFSQKGFSIRNAVDDNLNTAWAVDPRQGQPHWAVFVPAQPVDGPGRVRLTVRLDTGDAKWVRTTLGRFRLSVTSAKPERLAAEEMPAADHAIGPWERLGVALEVVGGDHGRAAAAFAMAARRAESADHVARAYDLALRAGVPFEELARARPGDARLWIAGGLLRATLSLWDEAAGDYRRGMERPLPSDLRPQPLPSDLRRLDRQYALLLVLSGDEEGYRRHCRRLVEQFGDSENEHDAHTVAYACSLSPESILEGAKLVERAGRAEAVWKLPDNRFLVGLARYRAGRFDEAIAALSEEPALKDWAKAWVVLAMAHHRLGKADEARAWLTKAAEWYDRATKDATGPLLPWPSGPAWWDDLNPAWGQQAQFQVLYLEAKRLIEGPDAKDPNRAVLQARGRALLKKVTGDH